MKADANTYHPLHHNSGGCSLYPGGWRRHIWRYFTYDVRYRFIEGLHRQVLCRIRLHDYASVFVQPTDKAPTVVACHHCGFPMPTAMTAIEWIEDDE